MRVLAESSDIGDGLPSEIEHRTPAWSKSKSWAQDLDNINVGCLQNLNEAFESCQDGLQSDDWEHTPLDIWDQRLEETFELLRIQANRAIDESKAKAKTCLQGIPAGAKKEAVGWFASGMHCVLHFFGFLRNEFTQIITKIKNSVRTTWRAILNSLRMRVATRAIAATSRIRKIAPVVNGEGIRLEVI